MSCKRCELYDELIDKFEELLEEFLGRKLPKCPRPPEFLQQGGIPRYDLTSHRLDNERRALLVGKGEKQ